MPMHVRVYTHTFQSFPVYRTIPAVDLYKLRKQPLHKGCERRSIDCRVMQGTLRD